ncbi:MAG: regulator of sigma protease [Solirubrobacterales bacterium]|nr:regulator of sigma protease [Solirubrobacterales bacterium]
MSYVLAAFGFAALVILHEAGHFAAAKAVGMRVEKFYLFFPPAIFKRKRGETEYGVGAIPLGGFVKITGMNPQEELPPEIAPRAYYAQPVWKRIVVIAAGPLVNIVIAFLLLFFLAFGVQKATTLTVAGIQKGTPAAHVLKTGDRIVSVDGIAASGGDVSSRATAISNEVNSHRCPGKQTNGCQAKTPVHFVVDRGGQTKSFTVTPYYDAKVKRHRIGFAFEGSGLVPVDTSIPGAAHESVNAMWSVTSGTVSRIAQIFNAQDRKKLHGIVGSYEITQQAFGFGPREALTLIAIISLSLAIVNLFPFLPLDGGHIFWSVVEKLRGRPVPFRVIEGASVVGFVLVLMLFAVGLSNDLSKLAGPGFHLR